jgi:hypothetical protein
MTDDNSVARCNQCHQALIEIDHYGERLIGCIECNRWSRDQWLFMKLTEDDLEALRARIDRDSIDGKE